jgi:hypothetical protein
LEQRVRQRRRSANQPAGALAAEPVTTIETSFAQPEVTRDIAEVGKARLPDVPAEARRQRCPGVTFRLLVSVEGFRVIPVTIRADPTGPPFKIGTAVASAGLFAYGGMSGYGSASAITEVKVQ